jgi:indolepyruvate ferredoxin oxidoreductase beta subunit
MTSQRPRTILICALGGEGGGVLSEWITECAGHAGLPAQATSVPGVAQRTGATSYYIELLPEPAPEGLQPVFALVPSAGRVDVVASSELLETARILERGFVSPERTMLISSSSRVYTTVEKMQMGDGRFDDQRIHDAAKAMAKDYRTVDLEKLANDNGTVISATMFGALAGAGAFHWPRSTCEDVIRAGKRGAEASLRGFAAAFDAVNGVAAPQSIEAPAQENLPEALPADFAALPAAVREVASHGLARVKDFQDADYGNLYLERLRVLMKAAGDAADPRVAHALEEGARRLALWMAYEDIPRVAQLKTRASRFERIRADAEMKPGQILIVTEYLKPGAEELADMLPESLGRRLMRRVEAGKSLPFLGRGIHVATTSIAGNLMLRTLSAMRKIRRKSLRYVEEQKQIDIWLDAMKTALARSPEFAGALAELPRLLKGYGETHLRGKTNYAAVFDGVVRPAISSGSEAMEAARLRKAIGAALADPESDALSRFLAEPRSEPPQLMAAQ